MPTPPIVSLRAFCDSDVAFFAVLASDERVTRFVGDGRPWTAEVVAERVAPALRADPVDQPGAARWFVVEEDGEEGTRPVGVLVSSRREGAVEIGYWLAPQHWGRGLAGAVVDRAVEELPGVYATKRFLARVSPGNVASARVLVRRGFRLGERVDGLEHHWRE